MLLCWNVKDITPVLCKNNKPFAKPEENKHTNMTNIKDKSPESNEKQNPIIGKFLGFYSI